MNNETIESFANIDQIKQKKLCKQLKKFLKMGKILQVQRIKDDSDYDDNYEPSFEKTEQQIKTAEELIKLVENYINEYYTKQ